MKLTQPLFFYCLFLICTHSLVAQTPRFDATYSAFPDAEAVMILNQGELNIVSAAKGYQIQIDYKVQIHILSEAGLANADISLPFYSKNGIETISNIQGKTMNVVDNKMVEIPLDKKQIFKENVNENWSEMRFSMPNVKVGSIIEYTYIQSNRSIRLFRFVFQKDIPVIKSQLSVTIPNFLGYSFLAQGTHTHLMERSSQTSWQMKNLPEIKRESYVSAMDDYIDTIILQLDSYLDRSIGRVVTLTDSWESLTNEFFTEKYIGKKYNKDKDVHALAQMLTAKEDDPKQKLIILHNYVRDNLSYNGNRRIISKEKSSDILKEGGGNSAAINLCLREMLHGVGIEAHPLLISTRQHGRIIKSYPLLTQFNHLICYAKIGDKEFFLDATDDLRPYDLLDFDDLNGDGWLLNRKAPRWVKTPSKNNVKENVTAMLELKADGSIEGEISAHAKGFEAWAYRKFLSSKGEKEFWQYFFLKYIPDGEIIESKIIGGDNPDTTFTYKVKFRTSEYVSIVGDKAYLYPMMMFGMIENPFLEPERNYPIDFVHEQEDLIAFLFRYPANWTIDTQPANARITFPNKEILMEYQIATGEGTVELRNRFAINNTYYSPEAYPGLKQLFDKSIARHGEPIVFNVNTTE